VQSAVVRSALELGKLSAVARLRRYGSPAPRAVLVALVAVLMDLNAIGAYGFLAKALIGHQIETAVAPAELPTSTPASQGGRYRVAPCRSRRPPSRASGR
jgi:hypothetical protein